MVIDAISEGPLAPHALRHALRRWRMLHRVKQDHAAELLGVSQSTISRWEAGRQAMESAETRKVEALVAARLTSAADAMLGGLVRESARAMHLICDTSHRLLASSPSRAASFGISESELTGRSLWRYSTPQLIAQEARLESLDWHGALAPNPVEFDTGDNGSSVVPIRASRCRWTRMTLSDGTSVRMVETLR
jgi:transcriptional regulator with XRE-family HTH domain